MRENLENFDPFYSPMGQIIIKSDPNDAYTVFLEASNEERDKSREIVFMKALQEQAEDYLKGGVISWDHLHKLEKSPKYIIGEPQDVGFKENRTFVKGKLYKGVEFADAVVRLLKAQSSRLGASIGGYVKKRVSLNKALSGITQVIWDETAVTYKPTNASTLGKVSLIPFGAFTKALMLGSGVDSSMFTGGRALSPESLQGANNVEVQPVINELLMRIKSGDIRSEDDFQDYLEFQGATHLYKPLKNLMVQKFLFKN
jgi:hypothetical protein